MVGAVMGPSAKRWILVATLALTSALLAWSGALERLAPWLTPPTAWRAQRSAQVAVDGDPVADQGEVLVRLNAENIELRRRLAEYAEIEGDGGVHPARSVLGRARVVARSDRASRRHLRIDAGAYLGVRRGMAVVVGWSLVGVVVGEHPAEALVRLVSDPESRIPAHLQTAAGVAEDGSVVPGEVVALGVLAGTGEPELLELTFVEDRPDLAVEPGMQVVTAGGPGPVPPGLVLGTVMTARRTPQSDHWSIGVVPLRRGDLASSVLVLRAPTAARVESDTP